MAISGTDSLGTFLDTGTNTQPTVRPSVEVETHTSPEVDSGSKLIPPSTLVASHIPHRPTGHPR